jgi:D-alanyl-D-alanine carboxypeptidase
MKMIQIDFKNIFGLENRTKYFTPTLALLSLVSISFFALLLSSDYAKKPTSTEATKRSAFDNVELIAEAAIVYDVVGNKELFVKNPDTSLPLASLTKVMTALIANKQLDNDSSIRIGLQYLKPEGDSGLIVGDTWQAKNLRDFTLMTSSNDGAFALAAVAVAKNLPNAEVDDSEFIKEMNTLSSEIGMTNSRFYNEHGLDETREKGGAYGSARDMATLFSYALKNYPEVLEATRYKNLHFKSAAMVYSAENTNLLVDQIPNLIASKTGYTDLAGGNLIVAFDAGLNRPIIIAVLGSSQEGRFSDTLKLVEAFMKDKELSASNK